MLLGLVCGGDHLSHPCRIQVIGQGTPRRGLCGVFWCCGRGDTLVVIHQLDARHIAEFAFSNVAPGANYFDASLEGTTTLANSLARIGYGGVLFLHSSVAEDKEEER